MSIPQQHTRTTALHYVSVALGDYAEDYDVDGITNELRDQLGGWDFTTMDDPEADTGVDFWGVVSCFARPISSGAVPACPSWCTLDKGHEYDVPEDDGGLTGFHEGQLAAVQDDDGGTVTLTMVQQITRHPDGHLTVHPPYVTMTTTPGGTDYSSAHTLRDLGDAIRRAAGKLEQQTERNGR